MKKVILGIMIIAAIIIVTHGSKHEYDTENLAQTELEVNNFFDNHSDIYSEEVRESVLEILNDSSQDINKRVSSVKDILEEYKERLK